MDLLTTLGPLLLGLLAWGLGLAALRAAGGACVPSAWAAAPPPCFW